MIVFLFSKLPVNLFGYRLNTLVNYAYKSYISEKRLLKWVNEAKKPPDVSDYVGSESDAKRNLERHGQAC